MTDAWGNKRRDPVEEFSGVTMVDAFHARRSSLGRWVDCEIPSDESDRMRSFYSRKVEMDDLRKPTKVTRDRGI